MNKNQVWTWACLADRGRAGLVISGQNDHDGDSFDEDIHDFDENVSFEVYQK